MDSNAFIVWMILAAIAVLGASGVPACLLPRMKAGQLLASCLMLAGGALGVIGVALAFRGEAAMVRVPWFLPWGEFAVSIDALSGLFLAPVFIVPALGSIYGLGYWKQSEHPENSARLGLFYGLLAGSMAMVVIARDGVLFLIAWEVMAISAYFAATAEDENPEVRRAGWVYLVATHMGTLCLIAMFCFWRRATGSFSLDPAHVMPAQLAGIIFVLAIIGFGFKAGLMPLHVWLPGAHANAPSHVSAVMSGVMLKMGVYGMVRMTSLLPSPASWWGAVLIAAGAISGVAGIVFALAQHDLKRLLAYSSIENIGIIVIGLGLALLGRSANRADWIVLGLGGALLHVWNHSLFKPLLFFNAGAIIHAAHTRDLNRLGGLGKSMPRVMMLFVVGAVAICALPPLNGFASEWLLYLGLFRTLESNGAAEFSGAAIAAVALAMIGALAVACFVKLLGAVFLGAPRENNAADVHAPGTSMMAPMTMLAAGCFCIGIVPILAVPLLDRAASAWAGTSMISIGEIAPLSWITALGIALLAMTAAIAFSVMAMPGARIIGSAGTWDCGYARPGSRMQYTGSSFTQMLMQLFSFVLWPRYYWPSIRGLFSRTSRFKSIVPDAVLDRLILPLFQSAERHLPRLRVLHQGQTQVYVLYVLFIIIVLLVWGAGGGRP